MIAMTTILYQSESLSLISKSFLSRDIERGLTSNTVALVAVSTGTACICCCFYNIYRCISLYTTVYFCIFTVYYCIFLYIYCILTVYFCIFTVYYCILLYITVYLLYISVYYCILLYIYCILFTGLSDELLSSLLELSLELESDKLPPTSSPPVPPLVGFPIFVVVT